MSIRLSGLSSNLDTESMVKSLVSAYSVTKDNLVKAQTKLSWKKESWKTMNTSIYSFYSKTLSNMKLTASYGKKTASVSDAAIAKVTASSGAVSGSQTLEVKALAASGYLTGGAISTETTVDGNTVTGKVGLTTKLSQITGLSSFTGGDLELTSGGKTTAINLTADMTVGGLVAKLQEGGVNASFDETNQRFFVSAKSSGAANDFTLTAATGSTGGTTALDKLGLTTGSVRTVGANAKIVLNGAEFSSTSNNFNINGLTIQALSLTGDDGDAATTADKTDKAITIVTDTDVDGVYDMIKGFLKEYNTLINSMDTSYNAVSSKGYEPLTDEEKDAMTDTEVTAWEKKIKDSLLRKDSVLDGVDNALKTDMLGSFTVNGKKTTLASYGINTLSYFTATENEKGAYHINGDTTDTSTSGNPDKLRAAIASDPAGVTSFFTQLASSVYADLSKRMSSTTMRSAYTIYNDKEMSKEYSDYTTKISDQKKKVTEMEDYYYKKFSAMETAISRLNSNNSSLSNLLGNN